ncbi:MAG: hypothetical protein AAFX94_09060, partial [Myxococcota bacterium]
MSRMTDGRLRLGVFMVALAQAACGDDLAQAAYGDDYEGQVRDWAGDVLLGIEFGQSAQISRRWTESPTLSLFSGNAEHSTTPVVEPSQRQPRLHLPAPSVPR